MSERGTRLLETVDAQISELTAVLSTRDDAILRLPCPGREKLGDGTVAACAQHTANNYLRIAEFLRGNDGNAHGALTRHERHAHGRQDSVDLAGLLERLSSGRSVLGVLAELTDEQLDRVPQASDMRFCDGQRTLEQVVGSLLKHQRHQVDAIKAAAA
jgi:hypothetical protein